MGGTLPPPPPPAGGIGAETTDGGIAGRRIRRPDFAAELSFWSSAKLGVTDLTDGSMRFVDLFFRFVAQQASCHTGRQVTRQYALKMRGRVVALLVTTQPRFLQRRAVLDDALPGLTSVGSPKMLRFHPTDGGPSCSCGRIYAASPATPRRHSRRRRLRRRGTAARRGPCWSSSPSPSGPAASWAAS